MMHDGEGMNEVALRFLATLTPPALRWQKDEPNRETGCAAPDGSGAAHCQSFSINSGTAVNRSATRP